MNQELVYETIPFEIQPEFEDEMFELENERGSRGTVGARSRASSGFRPSSRTAFSAKGKYRPPVTKPKPRPVIRGRRQLTDIIHEPYFPVIEPSYPAEPEPSSGSERVRWLQDCLNQVMGIQLPVTGQMGPETRSAVRSFQKRKGLRISGIVSPRTEQALSSACEGDREFQLQAEEPEGFWEILSGNSNLEQEFVLQKNCQITYKLKNKDIPAVVTKGGMLIANPLLPPERGVYVIKIGNTPYYVGIAANKNGVKARFDDRVKAVRDFGISIEAVNRRVDVYTLAPGVEGTCPVNRRRKGLSVAGSPLRSHAELLLLEQYLISKLDTRGKGNRVSEGIVAKHHGLNATFNGPLGVDKFP